MDEQNSCGAQSEAQRLQADAIAAVNADRVPPAFQEELLASVNALVESIECTPPPPTAEDDEDDEKDEEKEEEKDEKEDDEGRGKGKGNDKKKDKGKD